MSQGAKSRILAILIGLNLALIWGNSILPGEASGAMSGSVVKWLSEFLPWLATEGGHTFIRKAAHFSEFALLGFLWCGRWRLIHGRTGIGQLGMGLAAACIDETIQIFSPGRASSLLDVWLDTAGFAAGFAIILIGHTIIKYHQRRNHQMKKIALILAAVMLMGAMTACGGNATESTPAAVVAPEGATADLIAKIYENVTVELALATETTEGALADAEMFTYLTTLESMDGIVDASVNMPMMGAQAYHLVLVRAESADKAAEVAQHMYDNMDMARWVCVQANEKAAVVCGDLALFVMLDTQYGVTTEQIVDAFTTVCGGAVDSVIK